MYTFRHQALLERQRELRDRKRGELAEALGMLPNLARRRAELIARQQELQERVRAIHAAGELDVRRLVELQRHEQVLRTSLQELTNEIEYWETAITQRRAALDQAEREVKVWLRLDERHRRQHRQRQQKLEVQQADETSVSRLHFQQRVIS